MDTGGAGAGRARPGRHVRTRRAQLHVRVAGRAGRGGGLRVAAGAGGALQGVWPLRRPGAGGPPGAARGGGDGLPGRAAGGAARRAGAHHGGADEDRRPLPPGGPRRAAPRRRRRRRGAHHRKAARPLPRAAAAALRGRRGGGAARVPGASGCARVCGIRHRRGRRLRPPAPRVRRV
ncbi:MAG: hypothetical protein J3K34DRAFT_428579 [Monoraphidium minutum]|nr:MAG: hypothetical protein J3K34DRAFT_428579 [Monoraphidium minutum]